MQPHTSRLRAYGAQACVRKLVERLAWSSSFVRACGLGHALEALEAQTHNPQMAMVEGASLLLLSAPVTQVSIWNPPCPSHP